MTSTMTPAGHRQYHRHRQSAPATVLASPPTHPPNSTQTIHHPRYAFAVSGNCIEGDKLPTAVDVQFPWEAHPSRYHSYHNVSIPTMNVHKYPVTNAGEGSAATQHLNGHKRSQAG